MFNLGDRVKHLDTGNIGIVVGFGKRIVDRKCLEIAKVKLVQGTTLNKGTTVRDLYSKWLLCPEDYRVLVPNPLGKHLKLQPVKRYDLAQSAMSYCMN